MSHGSFVMLHSREPSYQMIGQVRTDLGCIGQRLYGLCGRQSFHGQVSFVIKYVVVSKLDRARMLLVTDEYGRPLQPLGCVDETLVNEV